MAKTSACLSCKGTKDTFNIFDVHICEGIEEIYSQMLENCFNIEINPEAGVGNMCDNCIFKLRDAHYFKLQIVKTYKELKQQAYLKHEYDDETQDQVHTDTIYDCFDYMKSELDPETGQMKYSVEKLKHESEEDSLQAKQTEGRNQFVISKLLKRESIKMNGKMENVTSNINIPSKPKRYYAPKTRRLTDPDKKSKKPGRPALEPGQRTCSVCEETFINTHSLTIHMHTHYPNHVCEQCGQKFSNKTSLKRHALVHLEGSFPCTVCDQKFSKVNSRNSHVWRVHKTTSPFVCAECGERFPSFNRRLMHLREAHGKTEPQYPCPYCERKYFYSGPRSRHIRLSHLRERSHECPHCPMAFGRRRQLRAHMASIHNIGEKKNQCPKCQKRFFLPNTLKNHMRTHDKEGDKQYKCEICNARFSYKCVLKCHMKCHEKKQLADELRDHESSNDTVYLEISEE